MKGDWRQSVSDYPSVWNWRTDWYLGREVSFFEVLGRVQQEILNEALTICLHELEMLGPTLPFQPSVRSVAISGAVGLAYYLSAYFSLEFTQSTNGLATIWPASGIFVAAL
ncbi:MAG: hypothetical protein HKO08_08445 [Erythrobacter sp.]|nr:hypothetical protein [Erythrobacter sp.]